MLQESSKEDEGQGDDGEVEEDGDGDREEVTGFNSFNWLILINKVSDRTKINWNEIWYMNIYEFFNYLQFDVEYKKMEERELEKWKQTH